MTIGAQRSPVWNHVLAMAADYNARRNLREVRQMQLARFMAMNEPIASGPLQHRCQACGGIWEHGRCQECGRSPRQTQGMLP